MLNRITVLLCGVALCACEAQGQSILIAGPDTTSGCLMPDVAGAFGAAGFTVSQLSDVSELDTADLSGYDVVWLPNGISVMNPSCPDVQPIPSAAGEANLVSFVQGGGGLYLAGEDGVPSQVDYLEWRDAFLQTQLGGGDVDGTCHCSLGATVYLDPAIDMNQHPNDPGTISTGTLFTGGFEMLGTSEPIAYANAELTGIPVAVRWNTGSLLLAPLGRVVAFNNSNNGAGFEEWAVNAATWLAGERCIADWNRDAIENTSDFVAYLNDFNAVLNGQSPTFGNPDLAQPFGVYNTADFVAFLNEYVAGCP